MKLYVSKYFLFNTSFDFINDVVIVGCLTISCVLSGTIIHAKSTNISFIQLILSIITAVLDFLSKKIRH